MIDARNRTPSPEEPEEPEEPALDDGAFFDFLHDAGFFCRPDGEPAVDILPDNPLPCQHHQCLVMAYLRVLQNIGHFDNDVFMGKQVRNYNANMAAAEGNTPPVLSTAVVPEDTYEEEDEEANVVLTPEMVEALFKGLPEGARIMLYVVDPDEETEA